MRLLSGRKGHESYGEIQWEDGNTETSFTVSSESESLIRRANSISFLEIFRYYNLSLDNDNLKSTCPFLKHKGGRENSASFYFYPETNSFHCFGCNSGRSTCDFVSIFDSISKFEAAQKIIELFGDSESQLLIDDSDNHSNKIIILNSFSSYIRDIYIKNLGNQSAISNIEKIISLFDKLNDKYDLSDDALESSILKLKLKIDGVLK